MDGQFSKLVCSEHNFAFLVEIRNETSLFCVRLSPIHWNLLWTVFYSFLFYSKWIRVNRVCNPILLAKLLLLFGALKSEYEKIMLKIQLQHTRQRSNFIIPRASYAIRVHITSALTSSRCRCARIPYLLLSSPFLVITSLWLRFLLFPKEIDFLISIAKSGKRSNYYLLQNNGLYDL